MNGVHVPADAFGADGMGERAQAVGKKSEGPVRFGKFMGAR